LACIVGQTERSRHLKLFHLPAGPRSDFSHASGRFDSAWRALDEDPTNLKWQQEMSALFEPVPGRKPGERFAMMQEVFYLE
jgi:L-rhamnose mutarotase